MESLPVSLSLSLPSPPCPSIFPFNIASQISTQIFIRKKEKNLNRSVKCERKLEQTHAAVNKLIWILSISYIMIIKENF